MIEDNNQNTKMTRFMILMGKEEVKAITIPPFTEQGQLISPTLDALGVTGMTIINLNAKQI